MSNSRDTTIQSLLNATEEQKAEIRQLIETKNKLFNTTSGPMSYSLWLITYVYISSYFISTHMDNSHNHVYTNPPTCDLNLHSLSTLDLIYIFELVGAPALKIGINVLVASVQPMIRHLSLPTHFDASINETDASNLIKQLQAEVQLLHSISKLISSVAQALGVLFALPVSLLLITYKVFITEDPMKKLISTNGLVLTVLTYFYLCNIAYHKVTLDIRSGIIPELPVNESLHITNNKIYRLISDNSIFSINPIAKKTISDSYFELSFKKDLSDHENDATVAVYDIRRIVKATFINYKIPLFIPKKRSANCLYISLATSLRLNDIVIANIKTSIAKEIQTYLDDNAFSNRVKRFADLIGVNHEKCPGATLPSNNYLAIPELKKPFITPAMLNTLFPTCSISYVNHYTIISGHDICTRETFKQITSQITASLNEIQCQGGNPMTVLATQSSPQSSPNLSPAPSPSSSLTILPKYTSSTFFIPSLPNASVTSKKHVIKFPSGIYDSSNNACDIHPLSGTGLPSGIFFIKSDLQSGDFKNPNTFKKFNTKVLSGQLANSRIGAQGFIFLKEGEVTCDGGRRLFAAGKIKVIGREGNTRVFLEKEISDGHELYIARGVLHNAHKNKNRLN